MNNDNLIVVGLNYFQTPLACRERLSVPPNELVRVLLYLKSYAWLEEIVVLSTCSRFEIIGVAEDPPEAASILKGWMLGRIGEDAGSAVYVKRGTAAIHHLFRVAAGLDSWIIGESEILGQVKNAYQLALDQGATRRCLNLVFQKALAAGKTIRSQTGLQNGIRSIGGAAAMLTNRIFGAKTQGGILVFGAGQAAEAVARHLAAKEFDKIVVVSRNKSHAENLAGPLGAQSLSLDEGLMRLSAADVAIFSLACPSPLINKKTLSSLLKARRRPLFLIDLGVPRNIDPQCAQLTNVFLYNLDDLQEFVRQTMEKKNGQKEHAESLASLASGQCAQELEERILAAAQERLEVIGGVGP